MSGRSQSRTMKIPCRCEESIWLTFLWTEGSGEGWIRVEAYHLGEKRNCATWMPEMRDVLDVLFRVLHGGGDCALPWDGGNVNGWLWDVDL